MILTLREGASCVKWGVRNGLLEEGPWAVDLEREEGSGQSTVGRVPM